MVIMKQKENNNISFLFKIMMVSLLVSFFITTSVSSQSYVPAREPVRMNLQVYQQAINTISNNIEAANQEYKELMITLSDYGDRLNNDKETLSWFEKYKQKISDTFNSKMNNDPAGARNYCIRTKGDIAVDPELRARIRTSEEYKEQIYYIQFRSDYSEDEKKEYIKNHPYIFIPIVDDDGEIIGGKLGTLEELEKFEEKKNQAIKKESNAPDISIETQLQQLNSLKENGRISDETYKNMREKILKDTN